MKMMQLLQPAGDQIAHGMELEGADVITAGYSGKVKARSFNASGGRPTLRLSTEEDGLSTHWVYAFAPCSIITNTGHHFLQAGMWAAQTGLLNINGGRGLVISVENHWGLNSLGGPVEDVGRLRYIDGCSDSVLYSPPVKGEPVLNFLHFPPETQQQFHTHPSVRIGIVARGSGRALIGGDGERAGEQLALTPGTVFVLPAELEHCFHTDGERMDIIAWHPDSDFGPTDENHPMVNKTLVAGQPVRSYDGPPMPAKEAAEPLGDDEKYTGR